MSATFPRRDSFPIHVFTMRRHPDGAPVELRASGLEDIVANSRPTAFYQRVAVNVVPRETPDGLDDFAALDLLPRVPGPSWCQAVSDGAEGWASALRDGHPMAVVDINEWALLTLRHYKRSIPASLMAATIDAWAEAWREDRGVARVPASVLAGHREQLRETMIKAMPARIGDSSMVVDTSTSTLYAFDGATASVDRIVQRFRYNAATPIALERYDLVTHLYASRRNNDLPAEYGSRFLEWLTSRAAAGQWTQITADLLLHVGHMDRVRASYGEAWKSRMLATGDEIVTEMNKRFDGEILVTEVRCTLTVATGSYDSEYDVTLDARGRIVRVAMLSGPTKTLGPNDPLDELLLVRAEAVREIVTVVRHLYELFDAEVLTELLQAAPQRGLFPVEVKEKPVWVDERPAADGPRDPGPLFVGVLTETELREQIQARAGTSDVVPVHMRKPGVSVTLTATTSEGTRSVTIDEKTVQAVDDQILGEAVRRAKAAGKGRKPKAAVGDAP